MGKEYKLHPFTHSSTINYQQQLNLQQLQVVENGDGACLVLAGAGSGKTRVLIYRLAYLLEKGINLSSILLVTFTNKAAQEMIHRSESLLKTSLSNLWAGTFHHIGNVILRKEAPTLGFSRNFTILDREDSLDIIDECIEELGYSKGDKLFPKKNIISHIAGLSTNAMRSPESIIEEYHEQLIEFTPAIKKVLLKYTDKKKKTNLMDFNDLLVHWYSLLQNSALAEKYSSLFQYILVDEYQDTNKLQFQILKQLASFHNNILAVGDDAQSIYSFRAADINNLLNFPQEFSPARIFRLETNYRSTPQILSLANQIITHNIHQFPKELRAVKPDDELPVLAATQDVYQQAKFVAQRILELNRRGIPLNKIAVLFRSRYQAVELEMELLKRSIPYIIRGGIRFFAQAHIKDVMAYLKALVNPKDELSFKRAISLHKGIGRGWANKIWAKVFAEKIPLEKIASTLPPRQKNGFADFYKIFSYLHRTQQPQDAINEIIKSYKEYCYLSFNNPEDRISDLEELSKMAHGYPTIRRFIIELSSYEDFRGETVLSGNSGEEILVLSTIHQSKGLEWEAVFIIGCCDYEFPHPKALNTPHLLEEERRLFYVAVTRAKTSLYLTYPQNKFTARNGIILTRPSMFLYEIPSSCYEEWHIESQSAHFDD